MMFLFIPFLFLVLLMAVLVIRPAGPGVGCCGMSHNATAPHAPTSPAEDPMAIARMRLARGELTPSEFDEIRRVLQA